MQKYLIYSISDNFEKLSDDPILLICSFLPRADLLKLSEVDKNFRRIITESPETIRKIPLVISFERHKELDLEFAIELAETRTFTALELNVHYEIADANGNFNLGLLLQTLRGTVDDLAVWAYSNISQHFVSSTIAMLLPKLKKCKLEQALFDDESAPVTLEINPQSNVNYPLESLTLVDTHASEVLQFFSGCFQLKTFGFESPTGDFELSAEDTDQVTNFLGNQGRLEKLIYEVPLEWDRLICFQLKELKVEQLPDKDAQLAVAKFLKKLPKLSKLNLSVANHPSFHLMLATCELLKLKELSLRTWRGVDEGEDSLEGLVNYTVKNLRIEDGTNVTTKILKMFLGIDSAYLCVTRQPGENLDQTVLDLSDVPCETIVKLHDDRCHKFDVKFCPSDLPRNSQQFESALMKFSTEFSSRINSIVIGHVTWRDNGVFRLSNSFCEDIVDRLPKLTKLEAFNIADHARFLEYLGDNGGRLKLRNVKLYKPLGVGEPKPKKMKIQIE